MKAMEGRVVQAEVIGWFGNLIPVKYHDDGTFDDISAYWVRYQAEAEVASSICSSALVTPAGIAITTVSPTNSNHNMCLDMLEKITHSITN